MLNPNYKIFLAPMEGITDSHFRDFLTRFGGYDVCVTEFLRVTDHPIPKKVFEREVPELKNGSRTPTSGTPVIVQLLGGDPDRIFESAANAVEVGANAIDLNFGCPAPTVNRNDGGATLLKYPHRLEGIIRKCREGLPRSVTVSAKMRLGFDDPNAIFENAKRAEDAGADWITIHGRTKTQGYTPPAYWEPIAKVMQTAKIPVIVNGEILSISQFERAYEITQGSHFMIGRAALGRPFLCHDLRKKMGLPSSITGRPFPENLDARFWKEVFTEFQSGEHSLKRLKQWGNYLNRFQPISWWSGFKATQSVAEALIFLARFEESATESNSKHHK